MAAPTLFSIRPARQPDAAAIAEVHRSSVRSLCARHYSVAQLEAWFEDRPPNMYSKAIREKRVWLAMGADDVLGFLEIRPAEIETLFARPAAVSRGIGSALLQLGAGIGDSFVARTFAGTVSPAVSLASHDGARVMRHRSGRCNV
jgi:GNAT superfamily N-acetyltransferase